MADEFEQGSRRDTRGRFVPGRSGNPAGKVPGTRNRATLLRAALDGDDGPAMARVVIDKALAGDVVTARFVIGRLEPKPRSRPIELDLPEGTWAEGTRARDIVVAFDATVRAMASGEITPDEAVQVTRVLDGRLRAIEVAAREAEREGRKRDERRRTSKPSPPGRGLGEGAGPMFSGADRVAVRRPHPGPLPRGEGAMRRDEDELGQDFLLPPRLRARSRFRGDLLHSTCIGRVPPLGAALAGGGWVV